MPRTLMPRAHIATVRRRNGPPDPLAIFLTLIEPVDPGLALCDRLRLEAALPAPRNGDLERAVRALHGLAADTVPAARLHRRGLLAALATQVLGQLGARHPLHQRLLVPPHQTALAEPALRPFAALQQLVQHALVDLPRHGPRCRFFPAWTGGPLNRSSDTLLNETMFRNLVHARVVIAPGPLTTPPRARTRPRITRPRP